MTDTIADMDDQWSLASGNNAQDDERHRDSPQGIYPAEVSNADLEDDMAVQSVKVSADAQNKDDNISPVLDSSRGPSESTSAEHLSDVVSVHSMPTVHVTAPDSTLTRRASTMQTLESASPSTDVPPNSPSRSHMSSANSSISAQERRNRHRSAIEPRSANRLSGFFNNLIHRRDHVPSPTSRTPIPEDPASPPVPGSGAPSRSSSPPPTRPVTPPPKLPPPTLQELGLSLSVLTSDLSPSHFSTPPSSGAFLAPNYLLLCHAQGLDVLPLTSPPSLQPYALIRRVSFKSVVVMEQRGVLVAIAGRRDGVRVYALEEVKKAVEWRIEMEVRRERDRLRRETVKKIANNPEGRDSAEKTRRASFSTPPPGELAGRGKLIRKGSYAPIPIPPSATPAPLIPRTPTVRKPKTPPRALQIPPHIPEPSGRPPPYSISSDTARSLTRPPPSVPTISQTRSRQGSVSNVLAAAPAASRRNTSASRSQDPDAKAERDESSDEEAINVVAAGSTGSQALDERTSARLSANLSSPVPVPVASSPHVPSPMSARRNRPATLDLTLAMPDAAVAPSEPSPTPTLLTLRQALSHSPSSGRHPTELDPETPVVDAEEEDDDRDGRISLAEALFESRIPDLPPIGTRRPQQPILLASSHPTDAGDDESSPRTSEAHSVNTQRTPERSRRRWSVMLSQTLNPMSTLNTSIPTSASTAPMTAPPMRERAPGILTRSQSFRSNHSAASTPRQANSNGRPTSSSSANAAVPPLSAPALVPPPLPESASGLFSPSPSSSSRSRFIPRVISNAFHARRSDDRPMPPASATDGESGRKTNAPTPAPPMAPPKLEYVKLPGTKSALMIKAVETAKKSFLAILCGDNGEKVELFAGTYRTALGLSRTFILPDSPRLLELQLQGDDLVEVFLVFSQNVFGLEPATVRVREVRIGRAERRAARRRARETRTGDGAADTEVPAGEDDTNVNVSIGVTVAVGSTVVANGTGPTGGQTPPLIAGEHPDQRPAPRQTDPNSDANDDTNNDPNEPASTALARAEELVALATAQMGPYTTFQQLSFAPKFPLASIADEYIIPPTYPDFLEYRTMHEPEANGTNIMDLTQIQFSPPGLPVPVPAAPCRWFYRDPRNNIHGPWKASLMQAWYKDGLLPPDLPVRREEDAEYMLLKDLRLQSVDPTHPFRSPPPPAPSSAAAAVFQDADKPLLAPISLLTQPRHFGPPALFFSSRGGHSTAIVDARGRSVLKGRFVWSDDESPDNTMSLSLGRMGDVKRLEAFDVKDRSVLVAMRQGGLEAVDLGDALLKPADESRTVLPQFSPSPSSVNRRGPFVWKIGTPVSSSATSATILSSKSKSGLSHIPGKKQSTGSAKSPAGRTEFSAGDTDSDVNDEVLFLGRKDDEIYFCERNAGSFRILRLCPNVS